MRHYRATIAYLGTPYYGFKQTRMGPSVQEELKRALEKILRHPVTVEGASLTDRGVHAQGQVIQFCSSRLIKTEKLLFSLRALLPKTIVPIELDLASSTFHPSLNATHKEYHYAICNLPIQLPFDREFSWHIHPPLNLAKMQKALPYLLGVHDFSALANQRYTDPVRHLMRIALIEQDKGKLRIEIEGDRFLYKMVRNIVGTLVWIGLGKITDNETVAILDSRDRKKAGPTAPAHGLTLKRVYY